MAKANSGSGGGGIGAEMAENGESGNNRIRRNEKYQRKRNIGINNGAKAKLAMAIGIANGGVVMQSYREKKAIR